MAEAKGRIGIVGGGLGGLASACVLAARGHSVTVFERNSWPGGKAAVLEEQGYRFDMGPTILTLPSVLRRIFTEAGKKLEDYLTLVPCLPQWRSFFEGGGVLDLAPELAKMKANLEKFAPGSSAGYEKFLALSKRLHDISNRVFFWKPIGSIWDMFTWRSLFDPGMLGDVWSMRMGSTVAQVVREFVPEQRVAQMLDHFTQYIGSSPDNSPAVLCGIAHMQTDEGIWYPLGGIGAVPRALAKLAGELGVEFRTGCGVRRILHDEPSKRVTGVETDKGEKVALSAVVSNADSVRTHRELIGGEIARKFEGRRTYEPACSGVVLYLGLDQAYDHVAHHNFVFSQDPHEEFEAIYKKGVPAPDPTCYVAATSKSEPGVAPTGGEALYILVHTPYLRPGQDWRKMLPDYRRVIIEKMKTTGGMPDLEKRIRFEAALTPQDIHDRYHVLDGAIYGLASHGWFSGGFKPSNRSPDLKGLYLAGGAAHPGPGMPMVLMSGWIAADTLHNDGVSPPSRPAVSVPAGISPPHFVKKPAKKEVELPTRIEWRVNWFTRYFRNWMTGSFHALRLAKNGRPPKTDNKPVLVVLNHPSWWDPLMALVLAELFKAYKNFGPIDARALKQYSIFEPLGIFGVENTTEGAIKFLRTSAAILEQPGHALWLTAQGRFSDPRERPVTLRPGVGHLLRRLNDVLLVPLALEYPFWKERYPEALASFGMPILIERGRDRSPEEWTTVVQAALTRTMDELAAEALTQDAAKFETIAGGSTGIGGIYDLWRRIVAWFTGQKFSSSHEESVHIAEGAS
jgi:phytoene desaturase